MRCTTAYCQGKVVINSKGFFCISSKQAENQARFTAHFDMVEKNPLPFMQQPAEKPLLPVLSPGCFSWVLHPPIVQIYPPISVSEAAASPTRVMACKANLYSLVVLKQLYTCKYTAINCAIVTLTENRG